LNRWTPLDVQRTDLYQKNIPERARNVAETQSKRWFVVLSLKELRYYLEDFVELSGSFNITVM
jgi:hypothetical protein